VGSVNDEKYDEKLGKPEGKYHWVTRGREGTPWKGYARKDVCHRADLGKLDKNRPQEKENRNATIKRANMITHNYRKNVPLALRK